MSDHEERRGEPAEQGDASATSRPMQEEADVDPTPLDAADAEPVDSQAKPEAGPVDTAAPPRGVPSSGAYMVFCVTCGAEMNRGDVFCHACGWDSRVAPKAPPPRLVDPNPSPYNRLAAILLCVLLGFFGLHRFYVGKVGTGVIWLLTLGFLGVGQIFDLVLIATGEFRDIDNRRVLRWSDPKVG